jgi:hypothetical protein
VEISTVPGQQNVNSSQFGLIHELRIKSKLSQTISYLLIVTTNFQMTTEFYKDAVQSSEEIAQLDNSHFMTPSSHGRYAPMST